MENDIFFSLDKLLAGNSVVLWDVSGLQAAGLQPYIQENYRTLAANGGRVLVPSFVYDALSAQKDSFAIMTIDRKLFTKIESVDNFAATFSRIKETGYASACVVLNDSAKRLAIFDAASKAKVFTRFYFLNDDGKLTEPPRAVAKPAHAVPAPTAKPRVQRFSIQTKPEQIAIAPLSATIQLGVGSQVADNQGKHYRLMARKAVSNQSVTYSTDTEGVWIKLFDGRSLNSFTEAKIRRMLTQDMSFSGICWPKSIITDETGCFRGYTLQAFEGTPLHLAVFKRAGIETNFPNWTKLDMCDLTQTILAKIRFLHSKNVLFGCINPAAIVVADKNKVFFTDTDNYQIDGFPSTVYNLSFTPPELLDKKMYLATKESEYFAVAQLVFMLMMPGKSPYANGSDTDPKELIRKGNFPYAAGRFTGSNVLPGMWRMMWTHLGSLRGNFYNVFHRNGKFNKPQDRRDAGYWESAVKHYREYLLLPENRESLTLYPKVFKREPGETFYRCRYCGEEHPREYFDREYFEHFQICNGCLEKQSNDSFFCEDCKRTFYYSNRTALFHRLRKMQDSAWKNQKHCSDCKKKTKSCRSCGKEIPKFWKDDLCETCNQAYLNSPYGPPKTCRDCGRPFTITVRDHEFYMSRPDMHEPTRCKACRDNKKNGSNNTPPSRGGFFGRWF